MTLITLITKAQSHQGKYDSYKLILAPSQQVCLAIPQQTHDVAPTLLCLLGSPLLPQDIRNDKGFDPKLEMGCKFSRQRQSNCQKYEMRRVNVRNGSDTFAISCN